MIPTRETTRGDRAYACLDGVRALAATSVFVYHYGLRSIALRNRYFSWISLLDLGVEIFFVVSGFLIYRPFVASHLGSRSAPELRAYARRRLLRIFPAYLVALFVLRATGQIGMNSYLGYLKHMTLTQTYFVDQGGIGMKVAWTLVIELSFYAFVPVWALVMRLIARTRHALAVELVGVFALIAVGFFSIRREMLLEHLPVWATVLPPSFAALGIGMLFAVLSEAPVTSVVAAIPRALGRVPAAVWWAAALLMYIALAQIPLGFAYCAECHVPSDNVTINWVQALIAGCIVLPAVFGDQQRGFIRRGLQLRPIAYVGLVSYGVYLWHVYAIRLIPNSVLDNSGVPMALVGLVAALALSVGIATISYFVIERPAMRLARHRIGTWLRVAQR